MSLTNRPKDLKKTIPIKQTHGSYSALCTELSKGIEKSVKGLKFNPLDDDGKFTGKLIDGAEMQKLQEKHVALVALSTQIKSFVNANDIFYIRALKQHLNIEHCKDESSDPDSIILRRMTGMLHFLKKHNYIQCCGKNKAERQYIRLKLIEEHIIIKCITT